MEPWDCEPEWEPSDADDIFKEAADKLAEALKSDVKMRIDALVAENKALKTRNEKLESDRWSVLQMKSDIEKAHKEFGERTRKMSLEELMAEKQVLMYRVDSVGKQAPKCDKCNENRKLPYTTPLGKENFEKCECAELFYQFEPMLVYLYEFRKDNSGKLLMWYRRYTDGDGYSSGTVYDSVFDGMQGFDTIDRYKIIFEHETDCKAYCDWLNENKVE